MILNVMTHRNKFQLKNNKHNDIQHNDTKHNDTKHNDTKTIWQLE
jgi:hypothetical protein